MAHSPEVSLHITKVYLQYDYEKHSTFSEHRSNTYSIVQGV